MGTLCFLKEACDFSIKGPSTKLHWELPLHLPGCASRLPSASQILSPQKEEIQNLRKLILAFVSKNGFSSLDGIGFLRSVVCVFLVSTNKLNWTFFLPLAHQPTLNLLKLELDKKRKRMKLSLNLCNN